MIDAEDLINYLQNELAQNPDYTMGEAWTDGYVAAINDVIEEIESRMR